MLELLKKMPGILGNPPAAGGKKEEKPMENGATNNTIQTSASIVSQSSVGSSGSGSDRPPLNKAPSLERLPSYLLRKGKKKKSSKPPDSEYKPIKVAPIKEDDMTMPDFLTMKNIKNVVSAVNEMKKSTKRRLSGPIAEAIMRKAADMKEAMPEEILEEEEDDDTDGDSSSVDTRRQESVSSLDSVVTAPVIESTDLAQGRDNMGLITEEETSFRRGSDVSTRSGSGRAPLRREKAFAGGDPTKDDQTDTDERDESSKPSTSVAPQGNVEGSGDANTAGSDSTSGIASPNNSFQSQDSTEADGNNVTVKSKNTPKDSVPDDEDTPGSRHDSGHVGEDQAGATTDIGDVKWPAKRTSYLWGKKEGTEAPSGNDDKDVEMRTRYVYNGIQNQ